MILSFIRIKTEYMKNGGDSLRAVVLYHVSEIVIERNSFPLIRSELHQNLVDAT